ncbi:MAG: TonB-dependent receptor [Flavobacteriaceae bacterium]
MLKNKFALIVSFLWFNMSIAQENDLKGLVVDERSNPLPYVNVVAYGDNNKLLNGVITDDNGQFELNIDLSSVRYIKLTFIGYEDRQIDISGLNSDNNLGIITLVASNENLDEVTITAKKPLIERKIDRLIVNVDQSILSAGSNTLQVLERAPGVFVDTDGSITLKGRNGVNVLINGRPQRMSSGDLSNYLNTLPASAIQKIELISNPSSAFDAEGTAGVINIVLKRNESYGTNGSVNASYGQGKYNTYASGVSINNRNNISSLYAGINYNFRQSYNHLFTDRNYNEGQNNAQLYNQQAKSIYPTGGFLYNVGGDFYISKKTTAGVNISGNNTHTKQDGNGSTLIYDSQQNNTGGFDTKTTADGKRSDIALNVNLRTSFNEDKGDFSADVDYAKYKNKNTQLFETYFFDSGGLQTDEEFLKAYSDGWLKLFSVKSDLNLQTQNSGKFSFGAKSSFVKNDNVLDYYDVEGNQEIPNSNFSNHFKYKENINALYSNWNYEYKKWLFQFGLRAEQTNIEGIQILTSESFVDHYFQLFPSLFLQYKPNDNYTFGFSSGRRINRPNYFQLNPFRVYVDKSTYREGNPDLKPEIGLNFEGSLSYKRWLEISLSYSNTKDNIIPVLIQDDQTMTTAVQLVNIGNYNYLVIDTSITLKPFKDFSSRWNLSLFYNEFLGEVTGFRLNEKGTAFRIRSNNTYSFGKGWSTEMSFFYQPKYTYGITAFDPRWKLDLGLQKEVFDSNGKISLTLTDMFKKYYPSGSTNFGNINENFISVRDTRVLTFAFSYNFGSDKVKSASKRTGAQEEKNRV